MSFAVPAELLDGVIRRFDPVEVFLFGSRARGDAGSDSDIDLYVIVDDDGAEAKLNHKAVGEARAEYGGAVDILVSRKSVFDDRRTLPGAMAYEVALEGVSIYAR